MSVLQDKKMSTAEVVTAVGIFLFSLGTLNLSGPIFVLLTFTFLARKSGAIVLSKRDLFPFLFSVSYFLIYIYHFEFTTKSLIIYLWGPWAAYMFGKWFVICNKGERAFVILLYTITCGFLLHSVLNLFTYIRSDYYALYAYQRISLDFWRGDVVSVISTGLMLSFAVALSSSTIFSKCSLRRKLLAVAVLALCIVEASFFAYRTMILITAVLIAFNALRWFSDLSVKITRKTVLIASIILIIIALFSAVYLNLFGIRDELMSLKIIQRLFFSGTSSRFTTWKNYISSGDWILYPFGGQKSQFAYNGQWVHNLWLDIINKVGIIPFIFIFVFTIMSVKSVIFTTSYLRKIKGERFLSNQILSTALCILLIFTPEPIIDANPYFFFAALIIIGGIMGLEKMYKSANAA